MKITRQFLIDYEACAEGYKATLELGLLDKELAEVEQGLRANNFIEYADWLLTVKTTEKYVRENGSVITMSYQVFNPMTGTHTRYETEQEALQALKEVAQQTVWNHCHMAIEVANENGDVAWIPSDAPKSLVVS